MFAALIKSERTYQFAGASRTGRFAGRYVQVQTCQETT